MNTIIRRIALCCVFLATVAPASFAQTTESIGNYTYDASGNVESIGPDTEGLTSFYDYDSAGRLIRFVRRNAAGTAVSTETFEYDAYGNLTKQTTNGTATTLPAAASTNRLTAAIYDAAGNMTAYGGETYVFDPVGTMTKKSGSWGNAFYVYTADDERIGIEGPDGSWRYMGRDLDGKVLREWSAANGTATNWSWVEDYIYRDGQLAAAVRPDTQGGVRHFHLDHLGSPRLITGTDRAVYAEHAYYAFGKEITSPTQELDLGFDTPEPMKFTGHERDFAGSYTGPVLDYMHARYYNPQAGRFLSVDPAMESVYLEVPQSWNRYSYVMNNPLKYTDPTGRVFKCETITKNDGSTEQICSEVIEVEAEEPEVEPAPEPIDPRQAHEFDLAGTGAPVSAGPPIRRDKQREKMKLRDCIRAANMTLMNASQGVGASETFKRSQPSVSKILFTWAGTGLRNASWSGAGLAWSYGANLIWNGGSQAVDYVKQLGAANAQYEANIETCKNG